MSSLFRNFEETRFVGRMNTAACETSCHLLEMYQSSLERQIGRGDWSPVCRDPELWKEVEGCLSRGAWQDTHCLLGLDPLSVMETSLQALPVPSGQAGLDRLAKAFEVLELAALNLYLCPWRKEYRIVKMFSGMFTHYIKPALTSQQVRELFGLLGYSPDIAGEEEHLRLTSGAVPAETLLQLACAFFAARVECRLLLSSVAPLGLHCELQFVRERRFGHSLQVALERVRRKVESVPETTNHALSDFDATDLYTDQNPEPSWQTQSDHLTAPPNNHYVPPEETLFSPRTSQLERVSDRTTQNTQAVCASTVTYPIKAQLLPTQKTESSQKPKPSDHAKQDAARSGQQGYDSLWSHDPHAHQCLQGSDVHSVDCPNVRMRGDHDLQQLGADKLSQDDQSWGKPSEGALKTHKCVTISRAQIFIVCHHCNDIHDMMCEDLTKCRSWSHTVRPTGKLQMPPPNERGASVVPSPERHSCLSKGSPACVICHTCNKSHDYMCEETQGCQRSDHAVKYQVEVDRGEPHPPPQPMPLHSCCTSSTQPALACFTCGVFHATPCSDQCLRTHCVQELPDVCVKCAGAGIHVLCRHCRGQYCKDCWFSSPINCSCGMVFDISSV